jgi:guanine nucleotide-binding protein G(i) subunit alpha
MGSRSSRHPSEDGATKRREKACTAAPKIVFVGASNTGKTTFVTQLVKLKSNSTVIDPEKAPAYRDAIRTNFRVALRRVVGETVRQGVKLRSKDARSILKKYGGDLSFLDVELADSRLEEAKILAADDVIRRTASLTDFDDNSVFLIESGDRVCSEDYAPSLSDAMRCYIPTEDAETYSFTDGVTFEVIDVNGSEEARKEWIQHFDNVTAVVFCASLNEYDQLIDGEDGKNRLQAAIELWKDLANSKNFGGATKILFLTKSDLMSLKLQRTSFRKFFPAFDGEIEEFSAILDWIRHRFEEQLFDRDAYVYTHLARGIDARNVEAIWNAMRDLILHQTISSF